MASSGSPSCWASDARDTPWRWEGTVPSPAVAPTTLRNRDSPSLVHPAPQSRRTCAWSGLLLAAAEPGSEGALLLQYCLDGLTSGALFALLALGYTMVYGIIELINFAHGDVFMLGSFLAFALVTQLGLDRLEPGSRWTGMVLLLLLVPYSCGLEPVDRSADLSSRCAQCAKLAPLVSAIGASFVLMNVGLLWGGPADRNFPALLPQHNLLAETRRCGRFTAEIDGHRGHPADHDRAWPCS